MTLYRILEALSFKVKASGISTSKSNFKQSKMQSYQAN